MGVQVLRYMQALELTKLIVNDEGKTNFTSLSIKNKSKDIVEAYNNILDKLKEAQNSRYSDEYDDDD